MDLSMQRATLSQLMWEKGREYGEWHQSNKSLRCLFLVVFVGDEPKTKIQKG